MFRGLKYSSIVNRLTWGLGSVLACTALVAMAGWYALGHSRQQVQQVHQQSLPALKAVLSVITEARQQRLLELQLIAQRGEDQRRGQEEELLRSRKTVEEALRRYQPLDALDRTHNEQVLRSLLAYWAVQDQVLTASRRVLEGSAAADTAAQLSQGVSLQGYTALSRELDAWRLHGDQLAEAQSRAALADDGHLGQMIALALLAAVTASGVTLLKLYRGIVPPMHQALAALRKLGDGEDFRVKVRRADEFGHLLHAIEDLREVMVPMSLRDDDEAEVLEVTAPLTLSRAPSASSNVRQGAKDSGSKAPEWAQVQPSLPLGAAASTAG